MRNENHFDENHHENYHENQQINLLATMSVIPTELCLVRYVKIP